MRGLVAVVLLLSTPALAGEMLALGDSPAARHAKKAAPKPWEALIESSRAALEAAKVKSAAPAATRSAPSVPEAVVAQPPALALPLPQPELPPLVLPAPPASDGAPDLVARAPRPAREPSPAPRVVVPAAADGDLDFDLLGEAKTANAPLASPAIEQAVGIRRTMLTIHQSVGMGLVGLMATTMITGQLNYLDRFGGGASTARYESSHKFFATATLATFAGAGLLAFFTPVPIERKSEGIDRAWLHKAGMIGATAGMIAEGTLGILTARHEGLADQAGLARAHLAIGYTTLACMTLGVGALVF